MGIGAEINTLTFKRLVVRSVILEKKRQGFRCSIGSDYLQSYLMNFVINSVEVMPNFCDSVIIACSIPTQKSLDAC